MEYLKSGISGFDPLLGKGILKESRIALTGPTGSGKTTFAMQFLVEGAKQFQQPGLYICLEDSKEALLMHMSGFNWNLNKMQITKQIFFLDYPVYEVSQFFEKESAIGEIINTMGVERVVIDSVMPIALSFKNPHERKHGLLKFFNNIRRWKTTTLVISEDSKMGENDVLPETDHEIETLSDGWFHLSYYNDKKGDRSRYIEVIKMKGSRNSHRSYPVELSDNGFSVGEKPINLRKRG